MPRHNFFTALCGRLFSAQAGSVVGVLTIGCTSVLLSACGGAEAQDVLFGASASSSGASSSGTSSGSTSASSSSSGTSASSGTSGTPGTCETPEEEPNDNKQEANVLAPSRCGTLSKDDNKDFLTFQLQPSTKTMSINFTGRIRLKVEVKGRDAVELTPENAGIVPFVMGQDYTIEVTALSDSSADIPWRVTVVEK